MNKKNGAVLWSIFKGIFKVIGVLLVIPVTFLLLFFLDGYGLTYETINPVTYLEIRGNYDNEYARDFITSFFPKEIEDSFSEVTYHYKARRGDSTACECYLEFVIEDPAAYEEFLDRYVQKDLCTVFPYDADFQEQSIANYFTLNDPQEVASQSEGYSLEGVKVGKILFSDSQQRIIFVAIIVYDGGGVTSLELNHFFSRFQIDPWEYGQSEPVQEYYEKVQRREITA